MQYRVHYMLPSYYGRRIRLSDRPNAEGLRHFDRWLRTCLTQLNLPREQTQHPPMPIPPRPMSQKGTREGRASVRRNIWWSVAGAYPTTCYTMYGDSDHSGEWKIHCS